MGRRRSGAGVPTEFYHGTALEAALKIQDEGFNVDLSGSNAGTLLGPGVYMTTTLNKALHYTRHKPHGGAIFKLKVQLGRCYEVEGHSDALQTSWAEAGYDSARANFGGPGEENCVRDPSNIEIVEVIFGHTHRAASAGYAVDPRNGDLFFRQEEHRWCTTGTWVKQNEGPKVGEVTKDSNSDGKVQVRWLSGRPSYMLVSNLHEASDEERQAAESDAQAAESAADATRSEATSDLAAPTRDAEGCIPGDYTSDYTFDYSCGLIVKDAIVKDSSGRVGVVLDNPDSDEDVQLRWTDGSTSSWTKAASLSEASDTDQTCAVPWCVAGVYAMDPSGKVGRVRAEPDSDVEVKLTWQDGSESDWIRAVRLQPSPAPWWHHGKRQRDECDRTAEASQPVASADATQPVKRLRTESPLDFDIDFDGHVLKTFEEALQKCGSIAAWAGARTLDGSSAVFGAVSSASHDLPGYAQLGIGATAVYMMSVHNNRLLRAVSAGAGIAAASAQSAANAALYGASIACGIDNFYKTVQAERSKESTATEAVARGAAIGSYCVLQPFLVRALLLWMLTRGVYSEHKEIVEFVLTCLLNPVSQNWQDLARKLARKS